MAIRCLNQEINVIPHIKVDIVEIASILLDGSLALEYKIASSN